MKVLGLTCVMVLFSAAPSLAQEVPLLSFAVCNNDPETIGLVLDSEHLDINQTSGAGLTALDLALENGLSKIAWTLIDHGAEVKFETLYHVCDRNFMARACSKFPQFDRHEGCVAVAEPEENWVPECRAPEEYCSRILRGY